MALTICLAGAVGVFPLLWGTTLICACLAALFRLNQAAMQAVNYLVYPLQIALYIPFFRLGERYLPWGPAVSPDILHQALHGRFTAAFALAGWATAKAACAWLVTVPPSALLLYPVLRGALRRRHCRKNGAPPLRRSP